MRARAWRGAGWQLLREPFRQQRRAFGRLALCSAMESVPILASGWLIARATDDGFLTHRPAVGAAWLGAYGAAMLLGALANRQSVPAVADVVETVRDALVRHAVQDSLRLAAAGAVDADPAAVARITRQTEQARQIIAGLLFTVRYVAFSTAAAVAGLLALAPVAALLAAPAVLFAVGAFALLLRALRPRQLALLTAEEAVSGSVGGVLSGLRDVLAAGAVNRASRDVDRRLAAQVTAARRLARASASGAVVVGVGARLPLLLTILLAPALVRDGTMTPGEVLGAAMYLVTGLEPALRMLVQAVGQMGLQLGTVLDRLAKPAVTRVPAVAAGARPRGADLEMVGVTFAHGPHTAPVLRNVSLRIPDGDHLAVVGPSGAGKSTFADVLAGLATPQQGTVLLGGTPLPAVEEAWLRRTVAMVPQESYVFAGSLRENLTYLGSASDEAVDRAVDALGLDELVRRLGGYDARLDDPSALSAGERQLVTLARAYLSPARIVILDEATCHLDPVAEARAEQAIAAQGRTLLVIAHRISSAARAHRVLVLDSGLAVVGDHASLIARSALYAEAVGLWQDTVPAAAPAR